MSLNGPSNSFIFNQGRLHYPRLLQIPSNLALDASLDNCARASTPSGKNSSLTSNLNLFHFKAIRDLDLCNQTPSDSSQVLNCFGVLKSRVLLTLSEKGFGGCYFMATLSFIQCILIPSGKQLNKMWQEPVDSLCTFMWRSMSDGSVMQWKRDERKKRVD